jgi:hypothetical protein
MEIEEITRRRQEKFLELSPLDRVKTMYALISQIIALKAKIENVSQYEIYRRYLRDNSRHRDRKLERLLSPPDEGIVEESEEELL